jgi:glycosyltransferase involved in cell wall biosynthesis
MGKVVCNIAKNIYPIDICQSVQNMETFNGWLRYFDKVIIIGQSPDKYFHHSVAGDIEAYLLPIVTNRIMNYALFLIRGLRIGLRIKNEVSVWDGSEPTSGGIVGLLLKWISKKPLLVELQGQLFSVSSKEYGWLRAALIKPVVILACTFADKIRCVSETVKKEASRYWWLKNRLFVVPARCNVDKFNSVLYSEDRISFRRGLNIRENEILLVFFGRLIPSKGMNYFIDAMPFILKDCPSTKLLIIGDGPVRKDLEQQACKLELTDKIIFYGAVKFDEVPKVLSTGDISIMPSTDEGMGRSALESMAMNIPVLCSRVGGLSEVVINGENGFFFQSRDPADMAEKTIALIRNKDSLTGIGQQARKYVEANYSYEISINKFIALFKSILES